MAQKVANTLLCPILPEQSLTKYEKKESSNQVLYARIALGAQLGPHVLLRHLCPNISFVYSVIGRCSLNARFLFPHYALALS